MTRLFKQTPEHPFHISVGAVLVNEEEKICVHKMTKSKTPGVYANVFEGRDEIYILMRETLDNNETLEAAAMRGIREEFGAAGEIRQYLGSQAFEVRMHGYPYEKTTVYFEITLTELGERPEDEESYTDIEWHTPEFLIERMKEQGKGNPLADIDESKIIETYVRYR
jgi:ADP-ribose pyrophosphatase YjhB (NUDIX family)